MPARGPIKLLDSIEAKKSAQIITCLGLSFHILAYYEEDTGLSARIKPLCSNNKPHIIVYADRCIDETLDILVSTLPRMLNAPLIDYTVECSEDIDAESFYFDEITWRLTSLFRDSFYRPLHKLSTTNVEHFLAIGWNAEIAYGTGKEDEVNLPLIPAVVFAHTHPGLSCYPSARDTTSTAEFLAQGGIAEFIVSRSCMSVTRLRRPFSEGDYWKLKEISKCIKRASSDEDYLACLQEMARLGTVEFSVV